MYNYEVLHLQLKFLCGRDGKRATHPGTFVDVINVILDKLKGPGCFFNSTGKPGVGCEDVQVAACAHGG